MHNYAYRRYSDVYHQRDTRRQRAPLYESGAACVCLWSGQSGLWHFGSGVFEVPASVSEVLDSFASLG